VIDLLDATVVPGYTRIGYHLRKRGWDPLPRMDGKTVVVTGATSGLGQAAAGQLAELGARVLVVARNAERGRPAADAIGAELVVADMSSLASVRAAAEAIDGPVEALIHNAGAYVGERTLSVDGIELTFATNVLGPFLLTRELSGRVHRVITVSSGGMYTARLPIDDLEFTRPGYTGGKAYAATKRMQVVLNEQWALRYGPRGVIAHAMHPGWAATPGVAESLPGFNKVLGPLLRTADEGADTMVWLAAADEPLRSNGRFWHDRAPRATHRTSRTREAPGDGERLWRALESYV
jgi:dehydrogenase/reductase SDR family protein 12